MKKFLSVPVYSGSTITRTDQIGLSGLVSCDVDQGAILLTYANGTVIVFLGSATFRAKDCSFVQDVIVDSMQSNWRKVLFDLPTLPSANVISVLITP